MNLEDKVINFLGDSITAGVGVSAEENIYYRIIEKECKLKAVNGYGVSGTRIAKQKNPGECESEEEWFASRIERMDNTADMIVVFGGTNDYGHGDAEIGTMEDRTPETFYGACHDLILHLLKYYSEKQIVIMTPIHREDENVVLEKGSQKVKVTLKTYVDIIKQVANAYSLPVCDLYLNCEIDPKIPENKEMLCPDGLHPNDAGHRFIADCLGKFLLNLSEGEI